MKPSFCRAPNGPSTGLEIYEHAVDSPTNFPEEPNFQGKLMADCYAGYQGLELRTDGRILRGACAAHARRKVYESRDVYPKEASIVLAKSQQLYDIEERGKTFPRTNALQLYLTDGRMPIDNNDLDVWAYLKDILDRLLAGETDYEPLRPDIWRQSHPESIRHYRVRERRDQADRKQARRAARRKNPTT